MKAGAETAEVSRRRGGRPSGGEAASLRQAILDAAEAMFLQEGFSGAKVETIATLAGTTKQTIYARFGSKAALFVDVSNRLLAGRFTPALGEPMPLRDALVNVSEQALTAMLDPKLVRMHCIITAEAVRFPELARLTDEDEHFPGRTITHSLLAGAAASGELALGETRRAMLMLQDMVLSGPLRATALGLKTFGPEDRREWAEYAVDLFLSGALARAQ